MTVSRKTAKKAKAKKTTSSVVAALAWKYRKQGAGVFVWALTLAVWAALVAAEELGVWYAGILLPGICSGLWIFSALLQNKFWRGATGLLWIHANGVALSAWATTVYAYGFTWLSWWTWLISTVVFGSTWAWHYRPRRAVIKIYRLPRAGFWKQHVYLLNQWIKGKIIVLNWAATTHKAKSLIDSKLLWVQPEHLGIEIYRVACEHSEDVKKDIKALETAFHARGGGVIVTDKRTKSVRWVEIQVTKRDPLEDAIPFRFPVEGNAYSPIYMGGDVKGQDKHITLFNEDGGNKVLIFGQSRQGKSVTINGIMSQISKRSDLAIVCVDLKSGVELKPWARRAEIIATDQNQAAKVIRFLRETINARMALVEEWGLKVWPISERNPGLVVFIDEGAQISHPKVRRQIEEIAMLSAAAGMAIVWASQSALLDSIPGGLRKQANVRITHYLEEWDDALKAMGDLTLNRKCLDLKGKVFIRYDNEPVLEMRVHHGGDKEKFEGYIKQIIQDSIAYKPTLDPITQEILERVCTAKEYEIWHKITGAIEGLYDAELLSYEQVNEFEDIYTIELAPGKTSDELLKVSNRIASAIGVRRGGVLVVEDPYNAALIKIHVTSKDPLAEIIPFREPHPRKATDALYLGRDARGQDVEITVATKAGGERITVMGKSRGGKSTTINAILTWLGMCNDLSFVAIDMKIVEMLPWAPRFETVATDEEHAIKVIDFIHQTITARMQSLPAGKKIWTITPETPGIVMAIEEGAMIKNAKAKKKLEDIAMLCAAAGIILVWVSQRAVSDSIPIGLRSQRSISIGHQVDDSAEANKIFGTTNIPFERLNAKGKAFVKTEEGISLEMRVQYLNEEQLTDWIRTTVTQRPRLDAITQAVYDKVFAPQDPSPQKVAAHRIDIPSDKPESKSIGELIIQQLEQAGEQGMSRKEIMSALGIARTTFYKYLAEVEDEVINDRNAGTYIHVMHLRNAA